jgi:hypothetical protein
MEHINVNRVQLIGIIAANRTRHIAAHETALAGWKVKQVEAIKKAADKALKLARAGKQAMLHLALQKPTSYVEHYDRVLGMLRLSKDDMVKLGAEDYDRYVRDQWEWRQVFAQSMSMYGGGGGGSGRKKAAR